MTSFIMIQFLIFYEKMKLSQSDTHNLNAISLDIEGVCVFGVFLIKMYCVLSISSYLKTRITIHESKHQYYHYHSL